MKNLIFQKLILDILRVFLISWISVGLIVWVIQAVNFLDFMIEDGHGFKVYMYYSLLNYPKILHRLLPFIFFISLIYTLIKYESNNELIIFWSIGITRKKFINSLISFSLIILVFQIFLGSIISPLSQNEARSFLRESKMDFFPSLIKERKFIDTVNGLTIFIEKKNRNGDLKNVFIKEDLNTSNSNFENSSQIIYAKKGRLVFNDKSKFFILYDGEIIENKNSKSTKISFQTINFDLNKFKSKTTTYPKIQEVSSILLFKCLKNYKINQKVDLFSEKLNCVENRIKDINEEFNKRFYKPLYIPLLCLVCCFLIFKTKEDSFYSKYKLMIFILCFFIIIISEISLRYSTLDNTINYFLTLPLMIFLIIYSYLTITKFR